MFELLGVDEIGMAITDHYAMVLPASLSGFCFSYPDSTYFNVGKIDSTQAADMTKRSSVPLADVERTLAPNLGVVTRPRTGAQKRRKPGCPAFHFLHLAKSISLLAARAQVPVI